MPFTKDMHISPLAEHWQPKRYLFISIVAPMMLFLALVCAVELAAQHEQLREQHLSQAHLADKANQVRSLLEYELNSTLHLTTSLVSYIQSKQGALDLHEIDPWLSNLKARAPYVRNIGIAPNNTITHIFPLAGNEAALGFYYPDNKEQWPAVQRVIANQRPMLAGPVHLQQGGLGLVYRVPIFFENRYWGLVSTVLNFDEIYGLMHNRAEQLGIKVAIKDGDNEGKILFGDKDVIANNEVNLTIPGRNWQIISSHSVTAPHTVLSSVRIAGWLIAFVISVLFNSFLRSLALQNKILHELSESKYRFSQAFNSAPQGMALINHNGLLIDFNDSLCSSLGYNRADLKTHNFFTIVAPNQRERLGNIIEGIYPKPGANHQYESALLHKSGQVIDVILSLAPTHASMYESDWIVQIIDISHRLAFENLLQEEASYNQGILHAMADGVMILDSHLIVRSANPAAGKIFGCSPEDFSRQPANKFIRDHSTGNLLRYIQNPTEKIDLANNTQVELTGIKADGQEFPLELQLSSIQRKQEKLFIVIVRDISERKQVENAKHAFIASISHELRTPLTAITGSLRLMETGALGQFSEATDKIIRIAEQSANQLSLMIDDLLDVDRLLAGKMSLDLQQLEIYPIVAKAIDDLRTEALKHEINIALLSNDEQLIANVDKLRLHKILDSLLNRAIEYSPKHSVISVKILNANHKIRIEIIDQDTKVLTASGHIHGSPENPDPALAIARELANGMSADVGVSCELGKGKCFFIELPLAERS